MLKQYILHKTKDKSAQALVEFSLCMPLVLLLIGIIITVCQLVYAKEVCQAAAQSSCRQYINIDDKAKLTSNGHIENSKKIGTTIAKYATMDITISSIKFDSSEEWTIGDKSYTCCECTVTGFINTMFPVKWDGQFLTPNMTSVQGYCAMLAEY